MSARALVFAALSLCVSGCKTPLSGQSGTYTRCTCEYVTDFDQPGHIDVEVCARGEGTEGRAKLCASGLGVGTVTACRCEGRGSGGACESVGTCREAGPR